MIIAVNFGGFKQPATPPANLIAPLPLEYVQPKPNTTIKNLAPKPQ